MLKNRILALLLELSYVSAALLVSSVWVERRYIIPRSILGLQNPPIPWPHLVDILTIFTMSGLVFFTLAHVLNRDARLPSAQLVITELLTLSSIFSLSATFIYFFTDIVFNAHFFAASAFLATVLSLLAYLGGSWLTRQDRSSHFRWMLQTGFLSQLRKSIFSWYAVLILVITPLPVFFAVKYKRDRDFANLVNNIKMSFSDTPKAWVLADLYPGLTFLQTMQVRFPALDPSVAYVLERHGRIYRVNPRPTPTKELIIDFSERVGPSEKENGAAGFAFHPRFDEPGTVERGYVYVYHTHVFDDGMYNRLSRFDLSLGTPAARLASERVLIEIEPRRRAGFHNGGTVEFGPDGFLYLGIGDLNDKSSPQVIDQSLFGGIFRIDVDMRGESISHPIHQQPGNGYTQSYFIPSDNPFIGMDGVLEEFWALGLRNPFRGAFDPDTQKFWVADVGGNLFEEVNVIRKGSNHQWNYVEGYEPTTRAPRPETPLGTETPPYFSYAHTGSDRCIIGGLVYRGDKHPELDGKYIFLDNFSGRVRSIDLERGAEQEMRLLARADQLGQIGLTSVAVSPFGELLVTTLGDADRPTGRILALVLGEQRKNGGDEFDSLLVASLSRELHTIEDFRKVYKDNCSRCHGMSGRGDGPDYDNPDVPLPDFTAAEWQSQRLDKELAATIAEGGLAVGLDPAMAAWGEAFTADQIWLLVEVVREFGEGSDSASSRANAN